MRIITARELRGLSREQTLIIPFLQENLTPVGLDLTLGGECINSTVGESVNLDKGEILEIQHGDYVHVVTQERITMPSNWFGMIFAKVSLAMKGLTHLGTKIDPGYEGNLLLTFRNDAHTVISLAKGDKICNVAFFEIPDPGLQYEPRALKDIGQRIEPPISLRHKLDDDEIEQARRFYGRGLIDFYVSTIERFGEYERRIGEGLRDIKERQSEFEKAMERFENRAVKDIDRRQNEFEKAMEKFESRADRTLDKIDDFYRNVIIGLIILLVGAIGTIVYGIITRIF
jgi:deoxycytidine triphosphate deaminase